MAISIFKKNTTSYHVVDSYRGGLWEFNDKEIKYFLKIIQLDQEKVDFDKYITQNKSKLDSNLMNEIKKFIITQEIPTHTTFIARTILNNFDNYKPGLITAPFTIIEVSRLCNYNCYWCFLDYKDDKIECALTLQDMMEHIIDPMLNLGTLNWGISGGEPSLTLEKTLRTAKYIKEQTEKKYSIVPSIMLFTNGYKLSENAQMYKEAGITSVQISLASADPQLEQKLRKPPINVNSLEEVMKGIDTCKKVGLKISLNSVISPDIGYGTNIDTIPEIFKIASKKQVDLFDLNLACPAGEAKKNSLTFSKDDYDKVTRFIRSGEATLHKDTVYSCPAENLEENRDISCGTGIIEFYIDYMGFTYPCNNLADEQMRCSDKTVKEDDITNIWFGSNILNSLRQYDNSFVCNECGICEYRGFCVGSCIARIWHQYGRLNLQERPEYCYKTKFNEGG